jgi:tetratricopeptide (TPR) repeat protein
VLASILLVLAFGCQPSAGKGPKAPTKILTLEEAQSILQEERRKLGTAEAAGPAPTSVADVLDILKRDQTERFAGARDYLTALDGVDALSVRASLEMLWAEGQLTVAELARDRAKQKDAEATALEDTLKLQPNDGSLKARIDAARQDAERERRVRDALETLALPHYETGATLGREVVRRNPERADGYNVLANLDRLKGNWVEYERNMQRAQGADADRAGVLYARAMERAARLGDRVGARKELEALLTEHPDLARARAQLVVLEDDVEARYEQLQKLAAVNPGHALVALEGKALEREVQTARALRAPAAPPAAVSP